MSLPRLILLVVDPEMRSTAASLRAFDIARRGGARLHLLMAVFDPRLDAIAERVSPEQQRDAQAQRIETHLHWLKAFAAEHGDGLADLCCEVVWARAMHAAVITRVLELKPDLVIKDLICESVLGKRNTIRSPEWRLARLCPATLLLVQQDSGNRSNLMVATVDPTHRDADMRELDDRVVRAALPLAMVLAAPLRFVHVFPHRRDEESAGADPTAAPLEALRREDADAFAQFAESHGIAADKCRVLNGNVVEEILRYTERHSTGLLVIGSEYGNSSDPSLLGSHAEALIAQAGCDLLLVKPRNFDAALARWWDAGVRQGHDSGLDADRAGDAELPTRDHQGPAPSLRGRALFND